jgi:hypothetical protein
LLAFSFRARLNRVHVKQYAQPLSCDAQTSTSSMSDRSSFDDFLTATDKAYIALYEAGDVF